MNAANDCIWIEQHRWCARIQAPCSPVCVRPISHVQLKLWGSQRPLYGVSHNHIVAPKTREFNSKIILGATLTTMHGASMTTAVGKNGRAKKILKNTALYARQVTDASEQSNAYGSTISSASSTSSLACVTLSP